MPILSLISDAIIGGRSRVFIGDELGLAVIIDAASSVGYSIQNQVTEHAVEQGADVADHMSEKSPQLSVSGFLSDDNYSAINPLSFAALPSSRRKEIIEQWSEQKKVLTFYGYKSDVESVVIESASFDESLDIGEAIAISLSLKKLRIVSVAAGSVPSAGLTPVSVRSVAPAPGAKRLSSTLFKAIN